MLNIRPPENWKQLPDVEKAKYFASVGDSNMVWYMAEKGALNELPEAEQRQIVSQAFSKSADLRDKLASEGKYSKQEWEDQKIQEAGVNFSRNQRAKALEILLNPDGKDLKEQLREFSKPKE